MKPYFIVGILLLLLSGCATEEFEKKPSEAQFCQAKGYLTGYLGGGAFDTCAQGDITCQGKKTELPDGGHTYDKVAVVCYEDNRNWARVKE